MISLVLYPGEGLDGETTRGRICVYEDGRLSAAYPACAGRPGPSLTDRGGHSYEPTPAGRYLLGPTEHHVTGSWPMSAIPWGAQLRRRADGDFDWSIDGVEWRPATGPDGALTLAAIVFQSRNLGRPLSDEEKQQLAEQYRGVLVDPAGQVETRYHQNDFGEWAWNLNQPAGTWTPYFLHTTPDDEQATAAGQPVSLVNSHGCVHIRPADRDLMMSHGWLRQGVPFLVQPYGVVGPALVT